MKTGIELIAEERERQVEAEGWGPAHDAMHIDDELALAAACYALPEHINPLSQPSGMITGVFLTIKRHAFWPFSNKWWKPSPKNRIKELVKAGALIAAEIDRLNRVRTHKSNIRK